MRMAWEGFLSPITASKRPHVHPTPIVIKVVYPLHVFRSSGMQIEKVAGVGHGSRFVPSDGSFEPNQLKELLYQVCEQVCIDTREHFSHKFTKVPPSDAFVFPLNPAFRQIGVSPPDTCC